MNADQHLSSRASGRADQPWSTRDMDGSSSRKCSAAAGATGADRCATVLRRSTVTTRPAVVSSARRSIMRRGRPDRRVSHGSRCLDHRQRNQEGDQQPKHSGGHMGRATTGCNGHCRTGHGSGASHARDLRESDSRRGCPRDSFVPAAPESGASPAVQLPCA